MSARKHYVKNRGYLYERTAHNKLEAAFAEMWEHRDQLESLMPPNWEVTDRDRYVAATVIQWLGTNVGFSHMVGCLTSVGYSVTGGEPRDKEEVIAAIKRSAAQSKALQEIFDCSEPH